jgi:FKBP-type peptidyl-prolyl cis-trans isomerase FklB
MSLSDKLKSFMQQKENDNLKAGQDFLVENGKRENVVTLPSGLQYEVIKQGDGPKPLATNTVTCHYHGTTIKGEIFDSSVRRGQPASFPLNAVIKGWTEALQLMPVGSKWKLYIPPHLAYGNRGVSREIGPNSTLIFEVELISFK